MSSVAIAGGYHPTIDSWRFSHKIADWAIGFIVFLGGFVIIEPAPYELLLVPMALLWGFFGLRLNRHMMPMTILMVLYLVGGILCLTQTSDVPKGISYMRTTAFVVLSAIFFAAVISQAPERRLSVIKRAYIASATIASLIGIAAYFHAIPSSEFFLLYGRVRSTFQDPNVFGPFLILPIALVFHDIISNRFTNSLGKVVLLLILLTADFLAFSRATWGMTVLVILIVSLLAYLNSPRQLDRFRIAVYLIGGLMAIVLLLTVVLSIPEVWQLFVQRAHVTEAYDVGQYGRFERHVLGFFLVQEHPLGLGPFEFAKRFGEDEHNMWLKGFTDYGWLGGFSYIALAIWTLAASTPLLFKRRPWTPIVWCTYADFVAHLMIHNVIDNDHWRHFFLIYGMLWGAIAGEKMYRRHLLQQTVPPEPIIEEYRTAAVPRAPAVH